MRRRVLLCLTLISVSACNGDKIGQPISSPLAPSSRSISDGTFAQGNPDFFFLPPMVKNPSSSPNWTAGGFNASLHPIVHICDMSGTTEATATLTSTCTDLATSVSITDEQYYVNWQVPTSSTVFYRLSVIVGTKVLGWADVETGANASQLKNVTTGDYIALVDGRTLPVKFRIERYALCDVPGKGPCASSTVDLTSGGTVQTVLPGATLPAGIFIPAGAGTTSTTITVQSCPAPLPLDIPLFGVCVRVTADPALPEGGFLQPATVFVCDINEAAIMAPPLALTHDQADLITLHRLDLVPNGDGGTRQVITALPHAHACGDPTVIGAMSQVRGMLGSLRRGDVTQAMKHLGTLLTPRPLYAARFIDLGGGGFTDGLSDFQFALPAKLTVVGATDNQSLLAGTLLDPSPAVLVTDLHDGAVAGARVHFWATGGVLSSAVVTTDATGRASIGWTLPPTDGAFYLRGSGLGLGGTDFNGPRGANGDGDGFVDPFQPIHGAFDDGAPDGGPVTVLTGSVTLSATAKSSVCSGGPVPIGYIGGPAGTPGPALSIAKNDAWASPLAGSAWIGPVSDAGTVGTNAGIYVFRTQFTAAAPGNISGSMYVDDGATILLNGAVVGTVGATPTNGVEPSLSFSNTPGSFATAYSAGKNVLEVQLSNAVGVAPDGQNKAGVDFCYGMSVIIP